MSHVDPFATLGIGPTLEREAVKRAYFEAVRKTPPHADPEAFRRVRAAYEQLGDSAGLQRAWLAAPLDAERELALWHERWQARIDAACAQQRERSSSSHSLELLIEHCFRARPT